jgi:uncharacterized protein (UPF0248 family)
LQPLHELLDRIKWDPVFGAGAFAVGYDDRVAHREAIVPLASIATDPQHPDTFTLHDAEGGVARIPWHRVRAVYRDGAAIWRRPEPPAPGL